MLRKEYALVETIFACARIGAIVAPMNVRLIPREVREYNADLGCRAVITNAEFVERFNLNHFRDAVLVGAADEEGWQSFEPLLDAEHEEQLLAVTSLEDPYCLVMTGCTTGRSKGVLQSQGGMIITVLADIPEYRIGRGWQTISIPPGYHVAGMGWGAIARPKP